MNILVLSRYLNTPQNTLYKLTPRTGRGWHDMVSWRSSRDRKEWRVAASKLSHMEKNLWQAFHAGVVHDYEYRVLEWQLKERVLKPEVLKVEMPKRPPLMSLDEF